MFARINSLGLRGIEGYPVTVEADISQGLPGFDVVGMAGTAILMEKDLYGGNRLIKWQGKYWIMYHAYPGEGYEAGPAEVGLAWCEDEELLDWHFAGEPVFFVAAGGGMGVRRPVQDRPDHA